MVKAFAPVNIAWVKYMGKVNGKPANASFSMTLDDAGTHTEMKLLEDAGPLQFRWSGVGYVPDRFGQERAINFLKREAIWKNAILSLGYDYKEPQGIIEIETRNSVPAGTGIATSASGFAALTLSWLGIRLRSHLREWLLRYQEDEAARSLVSSLAGLGSGSACRSIEGPFVEWDPEDGTKVFHFEGEPFVDFILLLDQNPKKISSSQAHERVLSSPNFSGRAARVQKRLNDIKFAFGKKDLKALSGLVLDEAMDMHTLFSTSNPPFEYMNDASRLWVKRFQEQNLMLPSDHAVVTLDAGANVHVFVPLSEEKAWEELFSSQAGLLFVKSGMGRGARYDESASLRV